MVFGAVMLMSLSLTGPVQAQEEEGFEELLICREANATDNDAEMVIIAETGSGLKELRV